MYFVKELFCFILFYFFKKINIKFKINKNENFNRIKRRAQQVSKHAKRKSIDDQDLSLYPLMIHGLPALLYTTVSLILSPL